MKDSVFRKYDIRGVYPEELTEDLVLRLGFVLGEESSGTVAVGRDCRHSGSTISRWLFEGISRAGGRAVDLGVQTTPMTYFAAHTLKPEITVMVTGSHNPPEYNGFKIMYGLETIYGKEIQNIKSRMEQLQRTAAGDIEVEPHEISIRDEYIDRLMGEFSLARSLKVVVDAGNGTGGEVAVEVLKRLGCRVIPLFCKMDGSFPNHHPDPTVVENLRTLSETVLREKADLGIAFDGDADRLGVVDDRGEVIWGDRLMIILSRVLLEDNPGATVISEVKASRLLFDEIESAGGRALMCPTGHSLIKEAMSRENALLAGEMSGHIFFRDRYYGYDDALYASLRLLEILANRHTPLHCFLQNLPSLVSTPEIRESSSDSLKFPLVEEIVGLLEEDGYTVDTTDGARITFANGWGLVRASNTQPVLVLRFEAGTQQELHDYERTVRNYLEKARRKLDV